MSEHRINLKWTRTTPDFEYKTYNRDHDVTFKNGQSLGMSAAVAYKGNPDMVDPEEAFVASLSSCHMLTFLALAANRKFVVDEYEDEAIGFLSKNANGKLAVTQVTLRPKIAFAPGASPDDHALAALHEKAHEECFIANSVQTEITIESHVPAA